MMKSWREVIGKSSNIPAKPASDDEFKQKIYDIFAELKIIIEYIKEHGPEIDSLSSRLQIIDKNNSNLTDILADISDDKKP